MEDLQEIANKWAKVVEDGIYVLGKLGNSSAKKTIKQAVENLFDETSGDIGLSEMAVQKLSKKEFREIGLKKIKKLKLQKYRYHLSSFPYHKPDDIFGSQNQKYEDLNANIFFLWEETGRDLDVFFEVIGSLDAPTQKLIRQRVDEAKGRIDQYDPDYRRLFMLKTLADRGFELTHNQYSVDIKEPATKLFFRKKTNIIGTKELTEYFEKHVGIPIPPPSN